MSDTRPERVHQSPERAEHRTAATPGRPMTPPTPKLRPTVRPTPREVSARVPPRVERAVDPPPPPPALAPPTDGVPDDTAEVRTARPIRVRKTLESFVASGKPALGLPVAPRHTATGPEPISHEAAGPPPSSHKAAGPQPIARPPIGSASAASRVQALARSAEAPTERLPAAGPTKLPLASPPGRRRVEQRSDTSGTSGTSGRRAGVTGEGGWAAWFEKEALMGSGAKIGLIGVLALIVLVVAVWDKSNADRGQEAAMDPLPVAPPDVAELTATTRTVAGADRPGPANGTVAVRVDTGVAAPSPAVSAAPAPEVAGRSAAAPGQTPDGARTLAAAVRSGGAVQPASAAVASSEAAGAVTSVGSGGSTGRTYTVRPGDSLAKIAKKFYGDGRKYYAIVKANRDRLRDPNILPLGVTLRIPEATALASPPASAAGPTSAARPSQSRPLPAGARTHVVQRGETLYQIAKRYLGSGALHRKLFEANRDQLRSPDQLRAGMTIVIPATR